MKRAGTAALTLALLAALAEAAAVRWRYVTASKAEAFYVDDERRTYPDERTIRQWEKQQTRDNDEGRKLRERYVAHLAEKVGAEKARAFAHALASHLYRCKEALSKVAEYDYYSEDGTILYSVPAAELEDWRTPPPETPLEDLMLDVCKGRGKPTEYQ
jgi:hypothetical protein